MSGQGERGRVGHRIGARHLELHDTRVGQPDVRRRVVGSRAQRLLEDLSRPGDAIALEGFERRPPFDERAMRREQRIEPGIGFTRSDARHGDAEAVPSSRDRLDVGDALRVSGKKPAQAGDRLFEAVVPHRHVIPPGLQQIVFGDDMTGAGHEQEKDVQLAFGNRDRFPGDGQTTSSRIELEGFEGEACAGWHG